MVFGRGMHGSGDSGNIMVTAGSW